MEGFWLGVIIAAIISIWTPYPSAKLGEVNWDFSVCEKNGGLKSIRPDSYFGRSALAVCENGAEFTKGYAKEKG